ncbi:hypothetical protein V6N11_016225 [Hibiscus sabdariffa]|uniref:HMA domain-containing protein n=1 Tax=Hibiscus sabdariffa TaxID=183260 RepID=A0ABR2TUR9_9ROSI
MKDGKSRSKALKIAAGLSGVDSASLKGEDKSQIEITGNVDAVKLTRLLMKRFEYVDLVSVSDAGDEKKKESEPQMHYFSPPYNLQCYGQGQAVPSYGYVEHHEPPCSILYFKLHNDRLLGLITTFSCSSRSRQY